MGRDWTLVRPLAGLCLLILFLFSGGVLAQKLNFRTYKNEDGLPQTQITAVFQDQDGYIWIGTLGGASRYNGREWAVFKQQDGLSRNHVTAINQDKQGRILFGTSGGGITIYADGVFEKFPDEDLLGKSIVTDILVDDQGAIWVTTKRGVARLRNGEIDNFFKGDGLPDNDCRTLYQRNDGTLLVATHEGVVRFSGERFHPLTMDGTSELRNVEAIVEDTNEVLYFAAAEGLFVEAQGGPKLFESGGRPLLYKFRDATRDNYGTLWFATSGEGIVKIANQEVTELRTENGLAYNIATRVMADRENNLWIGTDAGLSKLTEGPFRAYTVDHGLVNDFTRAIFEDRDGAIWIGTRKGVSTWINNAFVSVIDNNKLPDERIYSFAQHPDGRLLIANFSGLTTYKDGFYENFTIREGLPVSELRSVYVDSRNRVWIAGNGICLWTDDGFQRFPEDHLLSQASTVDIVEDKDGTIWFGTRNQGLVGYTANGRLIQNPGIKIDATIWDLAVDGLGALWIATNGLGVYKYDGYNFINYSTKDSLTDDFVWQVLCASNGDVWIGHSRGLERLRNGSFVKFDKSDGLSANEFSATACLEAKDRTLWFGTGDGITKYVPSREMQIDTPPVVLVEKLVINDQVLRPRDQMQLERNQNNIHFHFAGLSFRNEDEVRFQFRLEGHDKKWRQVTSVNNFYYANLNPGSFRFMVRACNNDGVWSETPAAFSFSIMPAFWETTWFRLALMLAFILAAALYYRYKVTRIQQQKQALEKIVVERTKELELKNEELRSLSLSDSLTKLKNRRYLYEIMPAEIKVLQRRSEDAKRGAKLDLTRNNLGVMMIDLDHFKSVNDTYGHDAGDRLLQQLGGIFLNQMRSSDVVIRWGGEEFLILLKDLKLGHLGSTANKIMESVRKFNFDIGRGKTIRRTCSIGFAYLPGSLDMSHMNWESIIELADQALYLSKKKGRNRATGIVFPGNMAADLLVKEIRGGIDSALEHGTFTLIDSNQDSPPPGDQPN